MKQTRGHDYAASRDFHRESLRSWSRPHISRTSLAPTLAPHSLIVTLLSDDGFEGPDRLLDSSDFL